MMLGINQNRLESCSAESVESYQFPLDHSITFCHNDFSNSMKETVETKEEIPHSAPNCTGTLMDNSIKVLNKVLAYSVERQNHLHRGCLLLGGSEVAELNRILPDLLGSDLWHFTESSEDWLKIFKKKQSKRDKKRKLPNLQHPDNKTLTSEKARQYSSHLKQRISAPKFSNSEPATHKPSQQTSRPTQAQLKHLPDWARRLHQILVLLCQTEAFKPYVLDISPSDTHYSKICESIQPGLVPIGLRTIISKLELNGYQSALDAFNDIYCVWLTYYRIHPPGSVAWLQTYQASRAFLQQIANQPILDHVSMDAHMLSSQYGSDLKNAKGVCSDESKSQTDHKASRNVDDLFNDFLQKTSRDLSRANRRESLKSRASEGPNHNSSHRSRPSVSVVHHPITDAERELFQDYLTKLQAKHHVMLFGAFRKSAVWKSIERGEVELDDIKTSPPTFRKMIAWCRSQLAVEKMSEHCLNGNLHTPSPLYENLSLKEAQTSTITPNLTNAVSQEGYVHNTALQSANSHKKPIHDKKSSDSSSDGSDLDDLTNEDLSPSSSSDREF